jgi:hypothetical protein
MTIREKFLPLGAALLLAAACQNGGQEGQNRDRGSAPPVQGTAGDRGADAGGDARQASERAGAPGSAQALQQVEGKIDRASAKEVVIRSTNQPSLTLEVGSDTKVTMDGERATAEQLQPGTDVRAAYQSSGGDTHRAVRIEATKQKTK